MKIVAVSIPDEVLEEAERLARRTKRSRSRLFSDALREYLARHTPDQVTDAMGRALEELGDTKGTFASTATRRVLEQNKWQSPKAKSGGGTCPQLRAQVQASEDR